MRIQQGFLPGCIGRIVQMHATYYAKAVGFGLPFEAKVASELAAFSLRFDSGRDGLWLAEGDGEVHGSVAIDGSSGDGRVAHLRWFIASEVVRGQGVGSRLLASALQFCRTAGYQEVYLWTFDELVAARHLYEKNGFRLAQERRGSQWGKEVNEQRFVLRA